MVSMALTSSHFLLYQSFQKKGIISNNDVRRLHTKHSSNGDTLLESIRTINKHIKADDLKIVRTRDEETGKDYYVLTYVCKTAQDCWDKFSADDLIWNDSERDILYTVSEKILREEKKEISTRDIFNHYKEDFDVPGFSVRIEDTMERLIKDKWLKYDEETLLVTLGPRFLGQMRKWIPTVTNVVHCHCSLLVLRGYFCKCKQTGCHVKCLLPNHKTDPAAIRCKKCKKTIKSQKKVIQHKGSKQSRDKARTDQTNTQPGLVGLPNVGNSCYMNSILQIIANIPEIRNFLLNESNFGEKLTETVSAIVKAVSDSKSKTGVSRDLLKTVLKYFPEFRSYQQDPQEFLRKLLTKMKEKKCKDIFNGKIKSHVKCNTCNSISTTTDDIEDISLTIPSTGEENLEDSLKKHFRPEVLKRDNCVNCFKCRKKQDSTKNLTIATTPDILCLHLKRFKTKFSGKRCSTTKIETCVNFPFSDLTLSDNQPAEKFSLIGVVSHLGSRVDGGHYVAFCLNQTNNIWLKCDDDQVQQVPAHKVAAAQAYMLFYQMVKK